MSNQQKTISKKFGRPRSQRQALLKSLADSLILDSSIETTLPKAKAVARYTEKLVTKAKNGQSSLHQRRAVISGLHTLEAAHKLVDEVAPKLTTRSSGYFKVEKLGLRRGDSAQLARVSFVDDLKTTKKSQKIAKGNKQRVKASEEDKKTTDPQDKPAKQAVKDIDSKIQPKATAQAPKRSGIRGNR
ncbi:50S ribosomal protein L17 [Candidatus Saccharibacteria bacterium]|nr:50S ribosomal protein L17 [Candidatus Saccharibacteria bacterium]